jgi:hypothetical protein
VVHEVANKEPAYPTLSVQKAGLDVLPSETSFMVEPGRSHMSLLSLEAQARRGQLPFDPESSIFAPERENKGE